ncbi:helix-turn-helix domain-containing protein [Chryseobacterium arthrosphaerae]|uniref:helix-turn-helix domain-containing protein n=1 Tax=Chryseobacterium arthrosphaerae TaxID=651561 RepID=UPI0023E1DBA2|nr:helix-turn-helix domain-containing protein [Chryseobacterium arthrosphaerae]WES98487.1 helix-turn-helix domain-containing protein [Chryseobacterium arthrosphaerae]
MKLLTKKDLEIFQEKLLDSIRQLLNNRISKEEVITKDEEWIRSKSVRAMLQISPATLQNLRIRGKIRYKKVLGSYYYNKEDLIALFKDE